MFDIGAMERHFRLKVRGRLGERFGDAFGPVAVEHRSDHTLLTGRMVDQAYLDGVIAYIRSLGIELISVETEDDAGQGNASPSQSKKESGR